MILVVLGTFPTEFRRPLFQLEELCRRSVLEEEIVVQNGHTDFHSNFMKLIPFLDSKELDELYARARVVISHAGSGSVVRALKMQKKVIAIPRLAEFDEVVDDHQLEIVEEFAKNGYLIPWQLKDSLEDLLTRVEQFSPPPYISKKENIIRFLTEYIDSL